MKVRYVTAAMMCLCGGAFLLFGAGVAAAILWWNGDLGGSGRQEKSAHVANSIPEHGSVSTTSVESDELVKIVTDFLAARTTQDLAPLVRGSSLRPEEIAARLATLEADDGKVSRVSYMRPIDSRAARLESVIVTFEGGGNRIALLAPDADGHWRVDFDAFVRHVHPSWDKILAGTAGESTVRVKVVPDSYYNGIYRDDKAWACFALLSPDQGTVMLGYVTRGTPQYEALASSMNRAERRAQGGALRMTLMIRHTEGAEARQFEITRVLSDEWALGDQPLDDMLAKPGMK
ncbi:hypothetical protein OKA04_02265 [Luteolibacter flavescens]|uniref:Uncharacterized protein n=1 Tax=Luteolibacter flavescens TaxID=1859460 RepID=A0ABT3FIY6_9BACT|nr:hypothetical protein [Luteolibacter flavescens]MCW1883533.1 hypothetical protein [Luteolibacter flavescens]